MYFSIPVVVLVAALNIVSSTALPAGPSTPPTQLSESARSQNHHSKNSAMYAVGSIPSDRESSPGDKRSLEPRARGKGSTRRVLRTVNRHPGAVRQAGRVAGNFASGFADGSADDG